MGSALLVVDVQVAFVPLIWRGEELVDRIASLVAAARAQGVPVIAVQQTGPAGTQLASGAGLADLLAARDVDTVVITGVATDYCVDATARSALSHGLDVVLVSDGHAPRADGDPDAGLTPQQVIDHHNAVLNNAIHPGGQLRLTPAAEVFQTNNAG